MEAIKERNEEPQAIGWSKYTIFDFAEKLVNKLDFNDIRDSLETVISDQFGGKIKYVSYDELEHDGSMEITDDGFLIRVNNTCGYPRVRFTLAHELAHYILHSQFGEKRITVNRDLASTRVEWEANYFAAGFLMPRQMFMESFKKNPDPVALANEYNMSVRAIQVRCKELGLG